MSACQKDTFTLLMSAQPVVQKSLLSIINTFKTIDDVKDLTDFSTYISNTIDLFKKDIIDHIEAKGLKKEIISLIMYECIFQLYSIMIELYKEKCTPNNDELDVFIAFNEDIINKINMHHLTYEN